jgi:peptide/nickel transport system permease protein
MLVLLAAGVFGPMFLPNPNNENLAQGLLPPGTDGHLFGTDQLGRDVFTWVINGIRTSFIISSCVVGIGAVVGVSLGLYAGYFGGWVDNGIMRLVDLQLAVPPLLLFIAAAASFQPSMLTLIILLALVSWIPYARVVRARALSERESGFVAASRLAGSSHKRVLATHLLPVVSTIPIVIISLQFGYVLLWESGLSFLGLGVNPPQASLGYMIAQGREVLSTAWWVVVFPGLTILLIVVAANVLGEGLRRVIHDSGRQA